MGAVTEAVPQAPVQVTARVAPNPPFVLPTKKGTGGKAGGLSSYRSLFPCCLGCDENAIAWVSRSQRVLVSNLSTNTLSAGSIYSLYP